MRTQVKVRQGACAGPEGREEGQKENGKYLVKGMFG